MLFNYFNLRECIDVKGGKNEKIVYDFAFGHSALFYF
jgi:hypothetical protein